MEAFESVWDFLIKGGITMIPLAICSLIGMAIVIDKIIALRLNKVIIPEIVSVTESIRSKEDIGLALSICQKHTGPLPNLITTVLDNRQLEKEELKELVEETGRQEIRELEKGLVALETVAGIAPLLGLLGTVIGILRVFNVISEVGVGQATALSGGISEALITTIIGLAIGIPAVVFFNYFTTRAENLVLDIEKYSANLIRRIKNFRPEELEFPDAA